MKFVLFGPSGELLLAYILILGFLPAVWTSAPAFFLNIPAWSLFIEIICNALHGTILAKLSNMQLLLLAVASALVFIACFITGLSGWGWSIISILWLIPRELTCYLVGIWMFRTYGDAPLWNRPIWALGAFSLALFLSSINSTMEMTALIACPFIVRAALGLPRLRWVIWAGTLSYPLYATHVPIMRAARFMGFDPVVAFILAGAVAAAVTVAFEMRRPASRPAEAF